MSVATLRTRKLSKVILSLLLPSIGLAAFGSANATTFYVRTDGGDAAQCNGRADAAYPGSGTAQNCAWKNPNIALPNSGAARIVGGDTLLIGSGSYQIGSGGYMQAIPSGTSSAKTRILGNGATAPKLIGVAGVHRVLNLDGSSNVEVGNLEVTDGSDCVYNHSQSTALCTSTMPWARVGLYARSSSNVWLHDLNIHGMAKNGVNAGGLTNWTIERFKINKNGAAGWDGNIGTVAPNAGQMVLRNIEVAWNGCGEKVATGEPWACWAQQTGGYGDGFGTTDTGGQWLVEDAFVHHNTSDGLDFRYMDGANTTSVTMRRVYSVANAGNQVKIKGNALIENSVLVGHCTYFRGKDYMTEGDLCRAYGSSLLLILTGDDVATVRHNTIAGEGDAQIAYGEGTSTDKVYVQNNLVVGFPYYANTSSNTLFAGGSAPAVKSFSGNMGWNARSCPSGSICTQNPTLSNMTLASFDAEPLDGSPVIDKAPMISAVTTDFVMGARPAGAANDIGAYEKQAAVTPPPACTRAAPTLTLSGSTSALAAGTANTYSLTLKNNDSTGCANTSFSLARSIPSGWTGTLSAATLDLAPGTSASASLVVTSPSTAAAGDYGIGAGASSSVGAIHTASASSTYSVAASTCARRAATISVSGPTTAVAAGTTVNYTVSVRNNDDSCYSGKTFTLASTVPSGWTGAFAQSSSYITPGSTFTTTLAVNSATSATEGTYNIGVGTSTTYEIHTASTATTYSVAASSVIAPLTETVSTNKSSYKAGETVSASARVLRNGVAVSGASVSFTVVRDNGSTTVLTATTDADGYARVSFATAKGKGAIGTYELIADATGGSQTATATTTFSVYR